MTDRQLECIIAIADHRSLTGAAKQLYVSQSSLSQMLTKAEQELGYSYFHAPAPLWFPPMPGINI